jgi:hypothetical protein
MALLQALGIIGPPTAEGGFRSNPYYICKLASKYAESNQLMKWIDDRCKNNGKKGDGDGSDREAHRGSGPGESQSSRGPGSGQ